jgi:hypothetical protein
MAKRRIFHSVALWHDKNAISIKHESGLAIAATVGAAAALVHHLRRSRIGRKILILPIDRIAVEPLIPAAWS